MPIDTSMYAPVQQPSFMDQAAKMAQTQAIINQNKLFPGQQQLQQQAVQGGQVGVDTVKLDLAHKQYDMLNQQVASLATDPNLTADKVKAAGAQWVKMGMITPQMYDEEIKNIPQEPAQLAQYMKTVQMRILDGQQKMTAAFGSPMVIDNGQQKIPVAINPITKQTNQIGAPIQNLQTPAELGQPAVVGVGANNVPVYGTSAQFQKKVTGVDPATNQPVPGINPAPIATTPAPGEVGASEVTKQANAKSGIALQTVADNVPNRLAALDEMEGNLNAFEGGPGIDTETTVKKFIGRWGINYDPTGVAQKEQFDKMSKQIAAQQATSMGEGTDYKLGFMSGANPNSQLSNLGNKGIIHILKGNEDAIAIKNQAWQEWKAQPGNGDGSYDKFSTAFNKVMDPRVFQFARMDPTERAQIIAGMATKDQKPGTYNKQQLAFFDKLKQAQSYGWINPNGQ